MRAGFGSDMSALLCFSMFLWRMALPLPGRPDFATSGLGTVGEPQSSDNQSRTRRLVPASVQFLDGTELEGGALSRTWPVCFCLCFCFWS